MRYYLVTAKCGHVGKGKYHEVEFPIAAESKSEAAQLCLKKAKVKKQLKNDISCVKEITYEDYLIKKEELKNDVYVRAHTKREISDYIQSAETLIICRQHRKTSFETRKERVEFVMRKQRIMEEYAYA